jgi:16S rRNA (cytosine1402-N4)-methyltransferase
MPAAFHDPVLSSEALRFLITDATGVYVDATVGGGGHAEAICRQLHGSGRLVCVDTDGDAVDAARKHLAPFQNRLHFVHSNFGNLNRELRALAIASVQGMLFDLGVSSYQLNEPGRGFSFRADGKLDMRMDRRQQFSAWDVVNTYGEQPLADVLWKYGEERNSRRIARMIVRARPVSTTAALRSIVEAAVGKRFLTKSLARVFQAIRIEVNAELKNLQRILEDSLGILSPHGRIVMISYHSLEDRMVKEFFRREAAITTPITMNFVASKSIAPRLKILTKKPVTPSASEIDRNPRARSAKMRAAERCAE